MLQDCTARCRCGCCYHLTCHGLTYVQARTNHGTLQLGLLRIKSATDLVRALVHRQQPSILFLHTATLGCKTLRVKEAVKMVVAKCLSTARDELADTVL